LQIEGNTIPQNDEKKSSKLKNMAFSKEKVEVT
jgi:hypothetical protein